MDDYNFLLIFFSGLFGIIIIYFITKYSSQRAMMVLLQEQNHLLNDENQKLNQEKILFIQKIEQLNSKIEYQNQVMSEAEKARQESFNSAKAALFSLGGELSKQLVEIHKQENQEARKLSEQNIAKTAEKFNVEFERIINMVGALNKDIEQSKSTVDLIKQSLLSPSGAGQLAEITLENILKSSGLRAKTDFLMQYSFSSDSTKLRPDAIIFLPSNNLMIVDAKASKFLVDNQMPENLAKTMHTHLKSLASKDYAENIAVALEVKKQQFNHIITLMFLPTEHALEKIIEADSRFMQKAWDANIFPVGPTGLMNMLTLAKLQISDQLRSENHRQIIEEVKKLLISITGIAEYSNKLGNNIQSLVSNYDKFAASFNRNFLSKAKNIQKLGVGIGSKVITSHLERYQLVTSKSELIDAEPIDLPLLEQEAEES